MEAESGRHFLTFRLKGRRYAVPASDVAEIIRPPMVARLPQSPPGLLGLANLRGVVVPVASGRALLGQPQGGMTNAARAIVMDGETPAAFVVDSIEELTQGLAGNDAQVLDVQTLMASVFVSRPRKHAAAGQISSEALHQPAAEAATRLLTFALGDQEYALPLSSVLEVMPVPDAVTGIPDSEAAVRGVIEFRGGILPLLSLRRLLGFPEDRAAAGEKIIAVKVCGSPIGLVADRLTGLAAASPAKIENVPEILAARAGGESRICAIYRANGGKQLIPILATEGLFWEDVTRKLQAVQRTEDVQVPDRDDAIMGQQQIVVFRLGAEEFGLPVSEVEEVLRLPGRMAQVPNTPKFLEGVMNLRGNVLPLVDQRRRFAMPVAHDLPSRRVLVVRTPRHRAGLIVDGVSEIMHAREEDIGAAPVLAGERTSMVRGALNLPAAGRLVVLLDPAEALSRAEQDLLDGLSPSAIESMKT